MELVVVSQNNCAPCKKLYNALDSEGIEYTVFNISETESIEVQGETFTMQDLDVMGTPVTILFDEGEEIARVAGFNTQGIKMLISQM